MTAANIKLCALLLATACLAAAPALASGRKLPVKSMPDQTCQWGLLFGLAVDDIAAAADSGDDEDDAATRLEKAKKAEEEAKAAAALKAKEDARQDSVRDRLMGAGEGLHLKALAGLPQLSLKVDAPAPASLPPAPVPVTTAPLPDMAAPQPAAPPVSPPG